MANCKTCGEKISIFNGEVNGECVQCCHLKDQKAAAAARSKENEVNKMRDEAIAGLNSGSTQAALAYSRETGDFSIFEPSQLKALCSQVPITTGLSFAKYDITREVDIITSEVVVGVNIIKDLFSGVRDIVGGRSKVLQVELRSAKDIAMQELKLESLRVGGNGIIAIDLDYHQISSGTTGGMIMLVASGTSVLVKAKVTQ